ncbi:hypothetical protein LTR17_012220 [Elasticomyces elasticus]|nr:hypothetical protein LTR17_012220 [Elasticomyces elasticus]
MFRRTSDNLPQDPAMPANLQALGYKVNGLNQFVKSGTPSGKPVEFFDFYHSSNERSNEVRREAMHECARKEVIAQLGKLGVKQVFMKGEQFLDMRPDGPHVAILATDLDVLKYKKDVVVVVNEHMQDLGIWAYRMLMREPGIDGGSAVGLVKKLQKWNEEKPEMVSIDTAEDAVGKLKLDGADDEDITTDDNTPGVIILNPGELLYSHKLNRSMSQATWLARGKSSAIAANYKVHDVHNRVYRHETPEAHVRSVLEYFIPSVTCEDVRLFFVGISEGGEHLLKCLDERLVADPDDFMGASMEVVALIQPTHVPEQLKSQALTTFLATQRARSYVSSEMPLGTLLAVPPSNMGQYVDTYDSQVIERPVNHTREDSGSQASTSAPIGIAGALTMTETMTDSMTDSIEPAFDSPENYRSLQSKISDSYSLPTSVSAMQQSVHSLPSEPSSLERSGELVDRPSADTADSKLGTSVSNLVDSTNSLAIDRAEAEADLEQYDYDKDPVSCPTFSAGIEDVSEMIWPAAMDAVLEWFGDLSEYADEREDR